MSPTVKDYGKRRSTSAHRRRANLGKRPRSVAEPSDPEEYDVELVVDKKVNEKGVTVWLVKWVGYSAEHNSWIELKNFNDTSPGSLLWKFERDWLEKRTVAELLPSGTTWPMNGVNTRREAVTTPTTIPKQQQSLDNNNAAVVVHRHLPAAALTYESNTNNNKQHATKVLHNLSFLQQSTAARPQSSFLHSSAAVTTTRPLTSLSNGTTMSTTNSSSFRKADLVAGLLDSVDGCIRLVERALVDNSDATIASMPSELRMSVRLILRRQNAAFQNALMEDAERSTPAAVAAMEDLMMQSEHQECADIAATDTGGGRLDVIVKHLQLIKTTCILFSAGTTSASSTTSTPSTSGGSDIAGFGGDSGNGGGGGGVALPSVVLMFLRFMASRVAKLLFMDSRA